MKQQELMVGDYVMMEGDNHPHQIEWWADMSNAHLYEPIPITTEILEKNGFVKCKDSICYQWEPSSFQNGVMWCFYNGTAWEISITSNTSSPARKIDGVFQYVHELQHALRLCKIDKEIML